jgi:hypothetical protein
MITNRKTPRCSKKCKVNQFLLAEPAGAAEEKILQDSGHRTQDSGFRFLTSTLPSVTSNEQEYIFWAFSAICFFKRKRGRDGLIRLNARMGSKIGSRLSQPVKGRDQSKAYRLMKLQK